MVDPASLEQTVRSLVKQQEQLLSSQETLVAELASRPVAAKKDFWDRIGAIAPIISGLCIGLGGAYFTTIYNQQQLKLQEIQTIERFLPHLVGDERSKRAAILAISSLTDAKLAAKVAGIYASEGTVSALEQLAQNGSRPEKTAVNAALARALDNMGENYRLEKRYDDAVAAYRKALSVREKTYGTASPRIVPSLIGLAELYKVHGDYADAGDLLRRAVDIQKNKYGTNSPQSIAVMTHLLSLYQEQGDVQRAEALSRQIAESVQQETSQVRASGERRDRFEEETDPEPEIEPAVAARSAGNSDTAGPKADLGAKTKPGEHPGSGTTGAFERSGDPPTRQHGSSRPDAARSEIEFDLPRKSADDASEQDFHQPAGFRR